MTKERPEAGFNDQLPDLLCGRLHVMLGVLQQVIEEFAAGDLVGNGRPSRPGAFLPKSWSLSRTASCRLVEPDDF